MDQALLDEIPKFRRDIHALLTDLVGRAYFQEPPNTGMVYPCVLYTINELPTDYADNIPYRHTTRFTVTLIYEDPDSDLCIQAAALPTFRFDRSYTADDLNHFVFNLVF